MLVWFEKTLAWIGFDHADAKVEVAATEIIVDNYDQADGSRWVLERHVLDNGEERKFYYLCSPADDPEAIASRRAQTINEVTASPEIQPSEHYLG